MKKQKRIIFESKNTATLLAVKDRLPGPDEVRIKMHYTAVSAGTERDILTARVNGVVHAADCVFPCAPPGYSGSGVVENVGANVADLKPGDRVMVHGGGHQQYGIRPGCEVLRLPSDDINLMEAAFTVIAGFPLAAVRKVKIELGESCMVVGLGLLGLFSVQYARLSGAMPVIAVDLNANRRAFALKLGADYALDPSAADYPDRMRAITGGRGANSVIEVTGNGQALNQALACTAKFGRVALLGCTRDPATVDFYHDVHRPGISLLGAHSGARPLLESRPGCWTEMDDCRAILDYLAAKRLNFHDMISEVHSPSEAPEVYRRLASDGNFPIGVVFDWTGFD